ncbi:metallophosphoesterase [Helicobacter sp. 23-1045]
MKFIIVVLCFFVAFHLVAYYALIRAMCVTAKGKIIGGFCVLAHFALALIFGFLMLFRAEIPHFLYASLSITILNAVLFFTFGILNVPFLLALKGKKRAFIAEILFYICIVCICASIFNAARLPNVVKTDIYLPNLNAESTILMISDLHLSNLISLEKTQKIIDLALAQNADTIVLVGDIIDSKPSVMEKFLPELERLSAKNGVFFALGNHEFLFDADSALSQLPKNITPLVNQSKIIDGNYNLLGISDLSAERWGKHLPNINDALQGTNASLPKILLSHQPNIIKIAESKKADLILSGHTHGGQIFPFSVGAYFANPFLYGVKKIDGTQLYISQGAHLAVTYGRFLSRSEINLITLKKGE